MGQRALAPQPPILGHYLGAEVEPFHIALAGMTLVIGVLAGAEIVTSTYLERQPYLRAPGWSRGRWSFDSSPDRPCRLDWLAG